LKTPPIVLTKIAPKIPPRNPIRINAKVSKLFNALMRFNDETVLDTRGKILWYLLEGIRQ
jgi:hypothetical protein